MPLQLVIGNKNYSSWSMRPWVLMRQLGIPFEEVMLRFDGLGPGSPFHAKALAVSPAARVPVLREADGFAVWDSLAIVERLHELHPAAGVWPADAHARARARSLCAEMHAGFSALRQHGPMNIGAQLPEVGRRVWAEHAAVRHDVQRIDQAWTQALAASGGPMLFGAFSAADAFFAPVAMRLATYGFPVGDVAAAYAQRLRAVPGVAAWIADARAETDFVPEDEPYRARP